VVAAETIGDLAERRPELRGRYLGVQAGEEPEVELRPRFDASDFDVPGEAEARANRAADPP
jgi:hypothetical protein